MPGYWIAEKDRHRAAQRCRGWFGSLFCEWCAQRSEAGSFGNKPDVATSLSGLTHRMPVRNDWPSVAQYLFQCVSGRAHFTWGPSTGLTVEVQRARAHRTKGPTGSIRGISSPFICHSAAQRATLPECQSRSEHAKPSSNAKSAEPRLRVSPRGFQSFPPEFLAACAARGRSIVLRKSSSGPCRKSGRARRCADMPAAERNHIQVLRSPMLKRTIPLCGLG
jgi:hypothetical protein